MKFKTTSTIGWSQQDLSRSKATCHLQSTCQSVSHFAVYFAAHKSGVTVPEQLAVKDEIKREIAFYNVTRDNVMQGMKFLI